MDRGGGGERVHASRGLVLRHEAEDTPRQREPNTPEFAQPRLRRVQGQKTVPGRVRVKFAREMGTICPFGVFSPVDPKTT